MIPKATYICVALKSHYARHAFPLKYHYQQINQKISTKSTTSMSNLILKELLGRKASPICTTLCIFRMKNGQELMTITIQITTIMLVFILKVIILLVNKAVCLHHRHNLTKKQSYKNNKPILSLNIWYNFKRL